MKLRVDIAEIPLQVVPIHTISDLSENVEAVARSARRAQSDWAAQPVQNRLAIIRRARVLIAERAVQLAQVAATARRRPVAEVLTSEIIPLLDACKFLEREAVKILATQRLGKSGCPAWLFGTDAEIRREPLGLVLVIAASNYPIFLPGVQALQALVAGNAVLLKPGIGGTDSAKAFAEIFYEAGLDARLLRVLPEAADAARDAIAAGVDKVFLTGSAMTGVSVLHQLARKLVPATLELSGCDAVIVRRDADLALAARALAFGLRLNDGATCIAPRRVFVTGANATELEGRLVTALSEFPAREITGATAERLRLLVDEALRGGAHLLAGEINGAVRGPLVLAGVQPGMSLLATDIFAPVLGLVTVRDDEAAVRLANDCPFALGATIFSRDERGARALAGRVAAGVVVINDLIAPTADARLPFGGRKLSGFGVTRGAEGLRELTVVKVVVARGGKWRPHFAAPRAGDEKLFANYIALTHGGTWRQRLAAAWRLILRK